MPALANYETTVTSGGTTVLTVDNAENQFFTGTGGTVQLPVVSTLFLGWKYLIANLTSSDLFINSSGGNLIATVVPGEIIVCTCIVVTGTAASSWSADSGVFFEVHTGKLRPLNPSESLWMDLSAGADKLSWVKGDNSALLVFDMGGLSSLKVWEIPNVSGKIGITDGLADGMIPQSNAGLLVDSGLFPIPEIIARLNLAILQ